MPTYSYCCDNCHHEFDLFQKISDDPAKICPQCNEPKLRRLIGAGAGFIFKGSGFYITDYRSKEYKEKAKAEGKAAETKTTEGSNKDAKKDAAKTASSNSSTDSTTTSSRAAS